MNLKNPGTASTIIGLLGLSLLFTAPTRADFLDKNDVWETTNSSQSSVDSKGNQFITVAQNLEEENLENPLDQQDSAVQPSITLTDWQLHLFFGGNLFLGGILLLIAATLMLVIEKVQREKSQKVEMLSNDYYIQAIEAGDNYKTWMNLGNTLAIQGQHEEALKCFDRAIKYEPLAADAWKATGDSLLALRRWREALIAYNVQNKSDQLSDQLINGQQQV